MIIKNRKKYAKPRKHTKNAQCNPWLTDFQPLFGGTQPQNMLQLHCGWHEKPPTSTYGGNKK